MSTIPRSGMRSRMAWSRERCLYARVSLLFARSLLIACRFLLLPRSMYDQVHDPDPKAGSSPFRE